MVSGSSDIEIEINAEKLSDHFLMSPNDLHRGRGLWLGLTPAARCLLAALLTFSAGWRLRRGDIDTIMDPLGRDATSKILRELRTKGFLVTNRINTGKGHFRWQWRVFLRPRGFPQEVDQRDVCAGVTIDGKPVDGDTIDGKSVNGRDQEKHNVCAGGTIDGKPVTEKPSIKRRTSEENQRRTSSRPPSSGHGTRAPEKNDHDAVDPWTSVGATPDEIEIIKKKINTQNPTIGNLPAYIAAMHRSGDLAAMLAEVRHDRETARIRAAVATIRRMSACPHGEPGGDQPHPGTGEPLCPVCRDPQLAAQLAERNRNAAAVPPSAAAETARSTKLRHPAPTALHPQLPRSSRPTMARLLADEQPPSRRPMPPHSGCCITCAATGQLVTATDPIAGSYCPTHLAATATAGGTT